ncbi:MAG: tyrosine-type recombinase/integrase [Candidatus Marinimicrobia bacterium]|nr:tyrosine-type recombinase/integrase [Candidatus Neomarinimicrobiota bacterium]
MTEHTLRHCCASYQSQAGMSLATIGKHLGHRSMVSTARYSLLSPESTIKTGKAVSSRLFGNNA